jgi:hypothetical protein
MHQNQSIRGINSPARLSVSARHYFGSIGSLSALDRLPITGSISALISPARLGSHKSVLSRFLADSRHYSCFPLSRYTEGQCRIVEGFNAILGDCALFSYIVTPFSYCICTVILYKTTVILVKNGIFLACERLTPPPQNFCTPIFLKEYLLVFR